MSKQEKDYSEQEKRKIQDNIETIESKYDVSGRDEGKNKNFGLCITCRYFQCVETELSVYVARCSDMAGIKLLENRPVTNCTYFSNKFMPSLYEMANMATIIDKTNKGKQIGFQTGEGKEEKT